MEDGARGQYYRAVWDADPVFTASLFLSVVDDTVDISGIFGSTTPEAEVWRTYLRNLFIRVNELVWRSILQASALGLRACRHHMVRRSPSRSRRENEEEEREARRSTRAWRSNST